MKKYLLLFFLLGSVHLIYAQTSSTFDSTWASQFQSALDDAVYNSGIAGASAAVFVPGQGLWVGTSGDSYAGFPITSDMRFGIGSNTKLYVAVALLKLQEQGVLSLDDHLGKWVSGYPYIDTSVTIRQMLSHQTGFFDYFNDTIVLLDSCFSNPNEFWTPQQVLGYIGAPHFNAGDAYSYSNTNYLLAGLVIEAATGQTLEQNLHQYILDPLNMDSTFIGGFEVPNGPVAHEWSGGDDLGDTPNVAFYSMATGVGNIFSTPQEMVEWYRDLFNGDIINQASLQELLNFEPASNYGLGIGDGEWFGGNGNVFYIHSGSTLGYWTLIAYDRKTGSVVASFINGGGSDFSFFYNLQFVFYNQYPKQENDAGATSVISPAENTCVTTISPVVTLKNFGYNVLNSVDINYTVDGGAPATYSWSGSLDTSGSVSVSLPDIVVGNGSHSFKCYTSNPNSSPEGYSFNDTTSTSFITDIAAAQMAPLSEDFGSGTFPPEGWLSTNDPILTWQETYLLPLSKRPAAVKNNYFDWNTGYQYDLCLPMLDISGLSSPLLSFDYAYGPFPGASDTLQVMISADCGATYQLLSNKFGTSLKTAPATYNAYFPKDTDWLHGIISLDGYSGSVLIKFRDISGWGNNLWLDNVDVGEVTGITSSDAINDVTVFPNPFESATTILLNQPVHDANLILYDALGNEVRSISAINDRAIDIQREELAAGIYFFQLRERERIIASGKIVAD